MLKLAGELCLRKLEQRCFQARLENVAQTFECIQGVKILTAYQIRNHSFKFTRTPIHLFIIIIFVIMETTIFLFIEWSV